MARIRSIKPEIRTSEKVNSWPIELRYFWVLLWGYCDDYGRGKDNARLIVADAFPLDDAVDVDTVAAWMDVLANGGVITRYAVNGTQYFYVTNWKEHQKPSHPTASRLPEPPANFANSSGKIPEDERNSTGTTPTRGGGGAGSREKEGEATQVATPPSRFCSRHQPNGSGGIPCGPCADARKLAELHEQATISRTSPLPATKAQARSKMCTEAGHEEYPLTPTCALCDRIAAAAVAA